MNPNHLRRVARRGRAASEVAMLDLCEISRPSSAPPIIDPLTAAATPVPPTIIHDGRSRLRTIGTSAEDVEREDTDLAVVRFELKVPSCTGPYREGDVVRMTSLIDEALWAVVAGRRWTVAGVGYSTWQLHQVLALEEVTDGG